MDQSIDAIMAARSLEDLWVVAGRVQQKPTHPLTRRFFDVINESYDLFVESSSSKILTTSVLFHARSAMDRSPARRDAIARKVNDLGLGKILNYPHLTAEEWNNYFSCKAIQQADSLDDLILIGERVSSARHSFLPIKTIVYIWECICDFFSWDPPRRQLESRVVNLLHTMAHRNIRQQAEGNKPSFLTNEEIKRKTDLIYRDHLVRTRPEKDPNAMKVFHKAAELIALMGPNNISKVISQYDIQDKDILARILRIAAEKNPFDIMEDFAEFGIEDPEALLEIAKIAACCDALSVVSLLTNVKIEDESIRIELAKIAVAQKRAVISFYIKDFGITDEAALIEIAKIAAAQKDSEISSYIQRYGITDEAALIEIAKIAAAQKNSNISFFIQRYGITDEAALIEIAKIAATQKDSCISSYIQRYGITDQTALIEIAKIAATQEGPYILNHLRDYGIQSQKALAQIEKIAFSQFESDTPEGIENQKILMERVMSQAHKDGRLISELIQIYAIKDQATLIKIAKIAAAQQFSQISRYIRNYRIKDKKALIEIAKIAATQQYSEISRYIRNYGIKDKKALIEIARIAARECGCDTAENIKNYRIQNQRKLCEIVKIAMVQNCSAIYDIKGLSDVLPPKLMLDLLSYASTVNPVTTFVVCMELFKRQILEEKAIVALMILCLLLALSRNSLFTPLDRYNFKIEDYPELIRDAIPAKNRTFEDRFCSLFQSYAQTLTEISANPLLRLPKELRLHMRLLKSAEEAHEL